MVHTSIHLFFPTETRYLKTLKYTQLHHPEFVYRPSPNQSLFTTSSALHDIFSSCPFPISNPNLPYRKQLFPANLAQPLHNQIHTYKHTYFKPHIKIFFTLSHLITVNNVESMMLSDRSRRDSKLVVKNDLDVFSNLVRKIVSREEKGN